MNMNVERKRSFAGLGLFALKDFKRGEEILEYTGVKKLASEAFKKPNRYLFYLDEDEQWVIDGSHRSNMGRYLNHSCNPNAHVDTVRGKLMVYASKEILKGEEITIDYGKEYLDDYIGKCKCGCADINNGVI